MPGPLDWWNRIRRVVGPPGAPATRAAVPTDLDAARRAELASVFAHVDRVEAELRASEAYCDREVAAILARAEEESARILADASARAAEARAAAGTQRRTDLEVHGTELHADAETQAAALRQRAGEAVPALVDQAVAIVRSFALEGGAPTPPPRS